MKINIIYLFTFISFISVGQVQWQEKTENVLSLPLAGSVSTLTSEVYIGNKYFLVSNKHYNSKNQGSNQNTFFVLGLENKANIPNWIELINTSRPTTTKFEKIISVSINDVFRRKNRVLLVDNNQNTPKSFSLIRNLNASDTGGTMRLHSLGSRNQLPVNVDIANCSFTQASFASSPNSLKDGMVYCLNNDNIYGVRLFSVNTRALVTGFGSGWASTPLQLPTNRTIASDIFERDNAPNVILSDGFTYIIDPTSGVLSMENQIQAIPDIALGDYFKEYKQRINDRVFLNVTTIDCYLIAGWETAYTPFINRCLVDIPDSIDELFFDDYEYYAIKHEVGFKVARLKLPAPRFDIYAGGVLKMEYKQDNYYVTLPCSLRNEIELRPRVGNNYPTVRNGNLNNHIAIVPTTNLWNAAGTEVFRWLDYNGANVNLNSFYKIASENEQSFCEDNEIGNYTYKVTLAVGDPWMSRPVIISFKD